MFKLFKKKSEIEILQLRYEKLMKESHRLSTINRSKSDEKYSEADKVANEIEELKKPTL